MSSLIIKLTGLNKQLEFIKVQDIQRMVSVLVKEKTPEHTELYLIGNPEPVQVTESVGLIMQLASQHSNGMYPVKQ